MKMLKKVLTAAFIVTLLILFTITGLNYTKEKEKIKNLNQDIISLNSEKTELLSKNKQLQDENKAIKEKPQEINKTIKEIDGLILIKDLDNTIVQDLRYATVNNFTKTKIYSSDVCALRFGSAVKLKNANSILKKLGYRIKVYDAYRPVSAQIKLWSIVPDERYVANPSKGGSDHSKGCAVDVTLVDNSNKELNMPTNFDDFTGKAGRSSKDWTGEQKKNVSILTDAMKKAGFISINSEWWHFYDSDKNSYKALNVPLEDFLK
ncbi:MAG: M15 family metallopeptidase [Bacillota bacterium]|nr:M15 family metallopeptidase [Bacillota bacterium]